jgi:hypothetical protein
MLSKLQLILTLDNLKKRASINDKTTNAAIASGTLLFGKEKGWG